MVVLRSLSHQEGLQLAHRLAYPLGNNEYHLRMLDQNDSLKFAKLIAILWLLVPQVFLLVGYEEALLQRLALQVLLRRHHVLRQHAQQRVHHQTIIRDSLMVLKG